VKASLIKSEPLLGVLGFSHLARRFGNFWALTDANGEIEAGKITALTGENGSGKSTLLMILAGILKSHRGHVSTTAKGKIHLVSHQMMAYQDLTVMQNLQLAATLSRASKRDAHAALEYWKIAALSAKPLRTLSRGQLQRFLLSRAMLVRPQVLLLDEPFTGLDTASENRLAEFMRSEAGRGTAILFSEHDPVRARKLSQAAIHMQNGVCER